MEKEIEKNDKKPKNLNKGEALSGKRLTELSKALSYILRHGAIENKLQMDSKGFVLLDDVLNCGPIKKHKASKNHVYQVVEDNNKKRFELSTNENNKEIIRAVQGHTIKEVKNEDALELIPNIYYFPFIIHGTYFEPWKFIKETGLNKMARNCIHFAIGENVISGMRYNVDLIVEINGPLCVAHGIQLFISTNKVILSPGIEGSIPTKFFKQVFTVKTKEVLMSCQYQQVIVPILEITKGVLGTNVTDKIILKSILLIDIIQGSIKLNIVFNTEINNENLSSILDKFSNIFIETEFNKIPTILGIDEKDLLFAYLIQSIDFYSLSHPSLFFEYTPYKTDSNFTSEDAYLKFLTEKSSIFIGSNTIKMQYNDIKVVKKEEKPIPFKKQICKDVKDSMYFFI